MTAGRGQLTEMKTIYLMCNRGFFYFEALVMGFVKRPLLSTTFRGRIPVH